MLRNCMYGVITPGSNAVQLYVCITLCVDLLSTKHGQHNLQQQQQQNLVLAAPG